MKFQQQITNLEPLADKLKVCTYMYIELQCIMPRKSVTDLSHIYMYTVLLLSILKLSLSLSQCLYLSLSFVIFNYNLVN